MVSNNPVIAGEREQGGRERHSRESRDIQIKPLLLRDDPQDLHSPDPHGPLSHDRVLLR